MAALEEILSSKLELMYSSFHQQMEFFCATNVTICGNRGTSSKHIHATGVTISSHSSSVLNKTPSSARRKNVLMHKVWKQDRKENELWGGDILCFCYMTPQDCSSITAGLHSALALTVQTANPLDEGILKNKNVAAVIFSPQVSIYHNFLCSDNL